MSTEIVIGAAVVTADGRQLGTVKQVEASAFLVNAPRQLDYWLQSTLVKDSTAERLGLTFAETELGGYKMDRPYDHNEFKAAAPDKLMPSNVRDTLLNR
jgi:hypothetical protein